MLQGHHGRQNLAFEKNLPNFNFVVGTCVQKFVYTKFYSIIFYCTSHENFQIMVCCDYIVSPLSVCLLKIKFEGAHNIICYNNIKIHFCVMILLSGKCQHGGLSGIRFKLLFDQ